MKNFVEKAEKIVKKVATKKNAKKAGKGLIVLGAAIALEQGFEKSLFDLIDSGINWIDNTK